MSKLRLEGSMYGAAIVDETGDIVAIVDPGVNEVALMRPEDIKRAELLCQAPEMQGEIDKLKTQMKDLESKRQYYQDAERELSNAYLRLRQILNAFDTPHAPTPKQVWDHTEAKAKQLRQQAENNHV